MFMFTLLPQSQVDYADHANDVEAEGPFFFVFLIMNQISWLHFVHSFSHKYITLNKTHNLFDSLFEPSVAFRESEICCLDIGSSTMLPM